MQVNSNRPITSGLGQCQRKGTQGVEDRGLHELRLEISYNENGCYQCLQCKMGCDRNDRAKSCMYDV
jgi:hypothetical protein